MRTRFAFFNRPLRRNLRVYQHLLRRSRFSKSFVNAFRRRYSSDEKRHVFSNPGTWRQHCVPDVSAGLAVKATRDTAFKSELIGDEPDRFGFVSFNSSRALIVGAIPARFKRRSALRSARCDSKLRAGSAASARTCGGVGQCACVSPPMSGAGRCSSPGCVGTICPASSAARKSGAHAPACTRGCGSSR